MDPPACLFFVQTLPEKGLDAFGGINFTLFRTLGLSPMSSKLFSRRSSHSVKMVLDGRMENGEGEDAEKDESVRDQLSSGSLAGTLAPFGPDSLGLVPLLGFHKWSIVGVVTFPALLQPADMALEANPYVVNLG